MDIFEFAMQMEKDGEIYYRDLADKCPDTGMKRIFSLLADDEVKHYQVFEHLKNENGAEFSDTDILKQSKNIFVNLKEKNEKIVCDSAQIELYKIAQEIEKKSEEFYTEKAAEVNNDRQQELLLKIAEEEKQHYFLLDNIIELVSRPETWIENAEFNHLDEY